MRTSRYRKKLQKSRRRRRDAVGVTKNATESRKLYTEYRDLLQKQYDSATTPHDRGDFNVPLQKANKILKEYDIEGFKERIASSRAGTKKYNQPYNFKSVMDDAGFNVPGMMSRLKKDMEDASKSNTNNSEESNIKEVPSESVTHGMTEDEIMNIDFSQYDL